VSSASASGGAVKFNCTQETEGGLQICMDQSEGEEGEENEEREE